ARGYAENRSYVQSPACALDAVVIHAVSRDRSEAAGAIAVPARLRGPRPGLRSPPPSTGQSSLPSVTDNPSAWSSLTSTLNDSGIPGSGRFSPLTIAS